MASYYYKSAFYFFLLLSISNENICSQENKRIEYSMSLNLIVNAACAKCQFKLSTSDKCDLAVEVNSDTYILEDINIEEYGNKNNINGLCNVKRKAHVIGELKQNKIRISKFSLIPYKKKKKLY